MGAINRAALKEHLWPGIVEFFGSEYSDYEEQFTGIFDTRTSTKAYEEYVMESMFGLAPVKGEGSPITFDEAGTAWKGRVQMEAYALGFVITREAVKLEEQAAKKSVLNLEHQGQNFKLGVIEIPAFYLDFKALRAGDQNYKSTTRDVKRLLDELQASLNRSARQGGSVSLLAERDFDAPSRVSLTQDGSGNPLLQLDSDFDRAWSSVGRALQAADVRVDDLDRSLGVYYVNLSERADDPDDKPGFFSRLFGGAPDKDEIEARAERYQVRLTRAGNGVQVTLDKSIDTVAPADVARRVLSLIKDNLG